MLIKEQQIGKKLLLFEAKLGEKQLDRITKTIL